MLWNKDAFHKIDLNFIGPCWWQQQQQQCVNNLSPKTTGNRFW